MNIMTAQPKLVTFGIGLAITFVIRTAIGMIDHNQAFAMSSTVYDGTHWAHINGDLIYQ